MILFLSDSKHMPRVAVIGAGASGLTAVKACLEEGLDVVCFEKTSDLGGLWTYREENVDGVASIMFSTTTNTSKDMSAFSDFPPPPHFPNYMSHRLVAQYLNSYADAFGLRRYVLCSHSVLKVSSYLVSSPDTPTEFQYIGLQMHGRFQAHQIA